MDVQASAVKVEGRFDAVAARLEITQGTVKAAREIAGRCVWKYAGGEIEHLLEDIVGEVLARLHRFDSTRLKDNSPDGVSGLLWGIARNVVRDRARKERRRAKWVVSDHALGKQRNGAARVLEEFPDPSAQSPEERMNQADAAVVLHDVMAQLKPGDREVVQLAYLDAVPKTREEIASILGISVGAVRTRLCRALASLRAPLSDGSPIPIRRIP